jgi:NAD(P)-dependent dehydrogenase (short-subunit alcohol dehydrogenase family)
MRLQDKVAIITGAAQGFGLAIALGYAREGAELYLHEFEENAEKLEKVAQQVRDETGQRVETGLYDITTGAPVAAMTKDVLGHFGRIDILMNTTSGGWHGRIFDCTEAEYDRAIDRGQKAYFLTCQAVGKEMARVGHGKIINITSIVGKLGPGGAIPWAAARGGVDSMTAGFAQALGEYGVHCTALARGATSQRDLNHDYKPKDIEERLRKLPFGRLGTVEDLVGPAIFLASEDSNWITGSVVYADGGYTVVAAFDDEYRATEVPYRGP